MIVVDGGYLSRRHRYICVARAGNLMYGLRFVKTWYLRNIDNPSEDQLLEISLDDHILD